MVFAMKDPFSIQVTSLFIPLGDKNSEWPRRFNAYAMDSYRRWTSLSIVYDAGKENTFEKAKTYVMGYEPHSVLPFGLPVFLGDHAPCRDPNLGDSRILATSVVSHLLRLMLPILRCPPEPSWQI